MFVKIFSMEQAKSCIGTECKHYVRCTTHVYIDTNYLFNNVDRSTILPAQ